MAKNIENEQIPSMVNWFRETYPEIAELLAYCPRATRNSAIYRKGANYGGAELVLLYPNNGYSSLCVQVLNATERNSDCHKRWRVLVEHNGCKCVTLRDLYSFTEAVEEYLENSPYA